MLEWLELPTIGRFIIILIIGGFMPFTAISFLTVMLKRKKKEFQKALTEMDIHTSRSVEDTYSAGRFFLPVVFVTLICIVAITFFVYSDDLSADMRDNLLLTGAFFGQAKEGLMYQSMAVLSMAFLGGFLWSAQNIIRRMVAYDLSPFVYYSAGIRIILASVVALVLSFIIGKDSSQSVISFQASLGAISFLAGMFPERVLTYIINLYKRFFSPDELNEQVLSLYKIEGISLSHRERFSEIGIDNAQNLATASLTKLLIETPYGARQLLDWIGQAKLLCYAKENIDGLRQVGIRTVFDLIKVRQTPERLMELSEAVGINSPMLQVIHDQVVNDKGIQSLYRFHFGVDSPEKDTEDALKNRTGAENMPLELDPQPE